MATVGAEFGCAGAHDGIGRGDVGFLRSALVSKAATSEVRGERDGNVLLAVQLALQNLAMILHALDLAFGLSAGSSSLGVDRSIDVAVAQNVLGGGRHGGL